MVRFTLYSEAAALAPANTDCQNSVSVDLATRVMSLGAAERVLAAQPVSSPRHKIPKPRNLAVFIFALLPHLGHPNGDDGALIRL